MAFLLSIHPFSFAPPPPQPLRRQRLRPHGLPPIHVPGDVPDARTQGTKIATEELKGRVLEATPGTGRERGWPGTRVVGWTRGGVACSGVEGCAELS